MKFVQGEENSKWSSSTLGWGKSDSLAKLGGSARLENLLSHNPRVAWSAATSSNYLKETTGQVKSTPIQWALHTFVRQQSNGLFSVCDERLGLARCEAAGEKRSGGREEGAELWLQLRSAGSPQGPQQNSPCLRKHYIQLFGELTAAHPSGTDTGKCLLLQLLGYERVKSIPETEITVNIWECMEVDCSSHWQHQAILLTQVLTHWTLFVPILFFVSTVHLFPHFYKERKYIGLPNVARCCIWQTGNSKTVALLNLLRKKCSYLCPTFQLGLFWQVSGFSARNPKPNIFKHYLKKMKFAEFFFGEAFFKNNF